MKLGALLAGIDGVVIAGARGGDTDVGEVRDDSRQVAAGDVFVAVAGAAADGRAFVADAIRREAGAVIVEAPGGSGGGGDAPVAPAGFAGALVTVPSARAALAAIAANRFAPAGGLVLSAVTGTNGKTTTTYLVESMLAAAGIAAGVVGTVTYRVGAAFSRPAPLTTPGALALHALFADMHAAGATDVVLEASSHALEQGRLDGCRFRVAALTNVTQDHLDYHVTMDRYFDAKAILFERRLDARDGVAVLPMDKPEGRRMAARARAAGQRVLGVAATADTAGAATDVRVESMRASAAGLRGRIATPAGAVEVESPLVGDYNVENIVLAVGMAVARGLPASAIATGLGRLAGVPGRLERVPNARGILCVVDYAHTPDALIRSMAALRPLVAPGARLVTVFGCGGDRDKTKRPLMGAAAARDADLAIVTSDNPRTEDPAAIIAMVVDGVRREAATPALEPSALGDARRGHAVIADRRAAIRAAVAAARAGDVLLVAGKGHEDYQIVGTAKLHFDDREEAAAAFAEGAP